MTTPNKPVEEKGEVVIRFAGDSGDGMQLTGMQFTTATAIFGNDLATLPDYPSEIRAPAGSLAGVSGFQINFSSRDIRTPGDQPNVLVAMNPAALKTNIDDLVEGGILITNTDAFIPQNLKKAGYEKNPLEDKSLSRYEHYQLPISSLNAKALEGVALTKKEIDRCRNFYALGLMFWLFGRPMDVTLRWIEDKFKKNPELVKANQMALKAGYYFGETTEMIKKNYRVKKASLAPGLYRNITGNEATALGFLASSYLADTPLLYASYPITPASEILHELSKHKNSGVRTIQAEDEIAAAGVALGAAFAGALALTGTSGPGLALKGETINLAVMTELPLVIVNVQRGGPSTGLPTKTEQADLFQSFFGRNSESPLAVVAPATPGECFDMAIEAMRIAVKYMTPVIYLSDGYVANSSEPWLVPDFRKLPRIEVKHPKAGDSFQPYRRDDKTLGRPWAVPGTPGLEHRIGGLEKANVSGNVSHDPENHELMVHLRAEKIERIANDIPLATVLGDQKGEILLVGWGGTFGAMTTAVEELRGKGRSVSSVHLRYLNPFPRNLGEILSHFDTVLVPELNMGQLTHLLRAKYLVNARVISKVQGQPFTIKEIVDAVERITMKNNEERPWPKQAARPS